MIVISYFHYLKILWKYITEKSSQLISSCRKLCPVIWCIAYFFKDEFVQWNDNGILRRGLVAGVGDGECEVINYEGNEMLVPTDDLEIIDEPQTSLRPGCSTCTFPFRQNEVVCGIEGCNHAIHASCVNDFLEHRLVNILDNPQFPTCPDCRTPIPGLIGIQFTFVDQEACCAMCERRLHQDMRLTADLQEGNRIICPFCMGFRDSELLRMHISFVPE